MKSHMKISFFWLSRARNTCTAEVVITRETFYLTKTKIEIKGKKKRVSSILTKSKSVAFSLLFSIYLTAFECNKTSDWLNHSISFKLTKSWRKKTKNVLENCWYTTAGLESKPLALLTLYQTTNFRLFQAERVCRRLFLI